MDATEKNENISREIISILANNNCTVNESTEILHYVANTIGKHSTVQKADEKNVAAKEAGTSSQPQITVELEITNMDELRKLISEINEKLNQLKQFKLHVKAH